jgi:hypothetical protein
MLKIFDEHDIPYKKGMISVGLLKPVQENAIKDKLEKMKVSIGEKKKMKPIAAVAINILLQRIMGKAFESARYAFNFAIVTPRTDVDYATTNYLIKKLANLHN